MKFNDMQNTVANYINYKVINIKSEILYREAEDELFYFNNTNKALRKLKKAVEYTPCHVKSIILYADICFIKGNFAKALSLYLTASELKQNDFRITASIANCYNSLKRYEEALKYCNNALEFTDSDNFSLYVQVVELKIHNLVRLKYYDEAYKIFSQSRELLKQNLIYSVYKSLNEKIKLHRKLSCSGLKIV